MAVACLPGCLSGVRLIVRGQEAVAAPPGEHAAEGDDGDLEPGHGTDLRAAGRWELDRDPHLLETSVPGVFACGDVRFSPVKRVAAAVGEGSMAIAFVHQYLRDAATSP